MLRGLKNDLAKELEALLAGQVVDVGGPKAVAEILNWTGRSTEASVVERLEEQDPELAEEVRDQQFVFDDIARLTDREIQVILRKVDSEDLAVSLKGASLCQSQRRSKCQDQGRDEFLGTRSDERR